MDIDTDKLKTKQELIEELQRLRSKTAEVHTLRSQLTTLQNKFDKLQQDFQEKDSVCLRQNEVHKEIEKRLRMSQLIVERSPVILFRRLAGDDPRLEYISENLRQFGYEPEEFLSGKIHFRDIIHPDDSEWMRSDIDEYAKADVEEYTMEYRCLTKFGDVRWVEDQTSVVRDSAGNKEHNQGILIDITERKVAEIELRKSEEKFRRIVETAAEGFYLVDEDMVIQDVNNAYCRLTGYSREELIGTIILELVTEEFKQYLLYNRDDLLAQEYRVFEGTGICKDGRHVPLLIHGNTLKDDQGNSIGNMAFVTDMTEHKKALVLAGEVQKSLLPQDRPQVSGLDIAGKNVSCDEIGGDYYDFLWSREPGKGPFSVVVGDISGHGVDSALLMTTARAFLRMRASQPGTISEIVTAMNRHLAQDVLDTGKFMTLFYLAIDPDKKRMDWVRAGHDPALVYDPATDEFEELKGGGIALGVVNDVEYQEHHRDGLENGQIIAIGTDGIWEAFNREGEMFGKDRLRSIIRSKACESASLILSSVYDELNQFTLGKKSEDDITLVIIKVDGLT